MNFERLGGGSGETVGVNSCLKEEDKKKRQMGALGGFGINSCCQWIVERCYIIQR